MSNGGNTGTGTGEVAPPPPRSSGGGGGGDSPRSDPGWWAIALIVLFAGAILIAIGVDAPALSRLSDPAYARGLITWLIVLTAIGLAFILVYQAFNNSGQSEEGFRRGREVFAGLMGIVGTIVGFYFGSADKGLSYLTLADPLQNGTSITTFVSGGTPPYRYTVESADTKLIKEPTKVRTADTGWIRFELSVLPTAVSSVTITLTDSKELKATKKFDVKPGPDANAPPPPTPAKPPESAAGK